MEITTSEMQRDNFLVLKKSREFYERTHPTIAKVIKIKMQEICEDKILQATEKINTSKEVGNFVSFSAGLCMLKEWEKEQSRL